MSARGREVGGKGREFDRMKGVGSSRYSPRGTPPNINLYRITGRIRREARSQRPSPRLWWMAKTRRGHLWIVGAGEPLIFGWNHKRLGTFRHGLPLPGRTQQLCDHLSVRLRATKATERGLLSLLAPSFTTGCAIQSLTRVSRPARLYLTNASVSQFLR